MLSSYSVNQAGPSHLLRGVPCQDSCSVRVARDGRAVVAAVADGLGSEAHSGVGSSVAARVSVERVTSSLEGDDAEDLVGTIREAFSEAYDAVLCEAARRDEPAGEFDSTLCLAVLMEGTLWWGHSGDSGLICSHTDGTYELVTRMQRDDEGRVFPLCFSDRWEFGKVEDVSTFLLCTDGILEVLAPPILQAVTGQAVDTRLVRMFLHPQEGDAEHLDELEAAARGYWAKCDPAILDDDKTMVVVFDAENPPESQDEPYYEGPDWAEIRRVANELLYPQPTADAKVETEGEPSGGSGDGTAAPKESLAGDTAILRQAGSAGRAGGNGHARRATPRADATDELAELLVRAMARGASVTADCLLVLAAVAVESAEGCLDQLDRMDRQRGHRPKRPT